MAQGFEFFEHTADIGVSIHGRTLTELFENAARALYAVLGEFALAEPPVSRSLQLHADTLEDLLHDWLSELLFQFEAQHFYHGKITVLEAGPGLLQAQLEGGPVDFARSCPSEEIKAFTYHRLSVAQQADGTWRATVVFDV